MTLDLRDLIAAAQTGRFALPVFEVAGVALARAAVDAAIDLDSPVLLHPTRDIDLLMPSLVALATRASVPVAPVIGGIATAADAAAAIRLGAHGLILAGEAAPPEVLALAEACNVAVIPATARRTLREEEVPDPGLGWFGDILDGAGGRLPETRASWAEMVDMAVSVGRGRAAACIGRCGATGRVAALFETCRPRREVEHVVLYNPTGVDETQLDRILAAGTERLERVPGVRRVFVGRSVTPSGKYAHCWVIRFAGEGVIPLYRDHPLHAAFADELFRPIATDRMTIDFVDEG